MPKIGLRLNTSGVAEIRPTVEDIEQAVADIEYVLRGKMDAGNIWTDKGRFVQHSPKNVVDLADTTRPITGEIVRGQRFRGQHTDSTSRAH